MSKNQYTDPLQKPETMDIEVQEDEIHMHEPNHEPQHSSKSFQTITLYLILGLTLILFILAGFHYWRSGLLFPQTKNMKQFLFV